MKRNLKKRDISSDEDNSGNESVIAIVKETKELQKLRKKPKGVSAEDLAKVIIEKQEKKSNDANILSTGGFIDIKALKREMSEADDIMQIGTTFAVETNRRDEDTEMVKYVEEELAKIKGKEVLGSKSENKHKMAQDQLYELPSHLKDNSGSKKKTEDMISNQMLSGIPEVDLGIDVKIRNIEATEEAKQKLMKERLVQKDKLISDFVPTNIAVNFVQHNRYNIEDQSVAKRTVETPKATPILRVGDADLPSANPSENTNVKATDDFHFEKFRKHMRHY